MTPTHIPAVEEAVRELLEKEASLIVVSSKGVEISENGSIGHKLHVDTDKLVNWLRAKFSSIYEVGRMEGFGAEGKAYDAGMERGRQAEREKHQEIFSWLLGETDFRVRREGEGAYWWRKELRERLSPTPTQEGCCECRQFYRADDVGVVLKCVCPCHKS